MIGNDFRSSDRVKEVSPYPVSRSLLAEADSASTTCWDSRAAGSKYTDLLYGGDCCVAISDRALRGNLQTEIVQ